MLKAKACILMCMDFRFQKNVQKWLEDKKYLGQSDEVIVAGASRDLVKPIDKMHKKALLRQITLSIKLHDPDEIVIIDHQDCGGYGQDKTIPTGLDVLEDRQMHITYAKKAKELLEKEFPGREIKCFYAKLDGDIEPLLISS